MATGVQTAHDPRGVRIMLVTLLVVYVFNFLDRQIVNILAEPIRKDLGLSDTQIGLMTGLAFALFYTILGLPIARYADRPSTDRGRLIAVALVIWSGMTVLCGMAQNFVQLLLARIGVGVGEAGCTPAAHSLIADRVPAERRSSAMAFYALGIPIGSLLGMVIGGYLSDVLGWRHAFMFVGAPGVVMALFVVFLVKDKNRAVRPLPEGITAEGMLATVRALMSRPTFVLLLAAASACSFLSYGKTTWTTIFFQRTHGLTPGEVGFWFGLGGGVAGIFGTWLGGWLADRFARTDRRNLVLAPAIGMALAVPMAIFGYLSADWRTSLLLLLVPTVLNSLYYGPVFSSTQGLVAPRHRAMASALLLLCQNLIGLGLGPLFFGMLSDWIKPSFGEESVRYVLYGAALLGLVPALLFWLLRPGLPAELDRNA
ncbi:putative MFS family arabinose efflux permease [Novosphingobium kunmingense]|uniref:Putative MFS family arabinose efflux permease n=1 Tax=Novosphingobium kunmingense TaxID=1211806 RepID=A0A2N0I2L7_9SPHN|nr:MFS transporter [Novosphingobium kunmingense]PKB25434.1 putative MFS family arabinose efflux permease [Novosphingobium kunmingense]